MGTVNNDWLEVHVAGRSAQAEEYEAWLFAAGALSVTYHDAIDDDELTHAVLEPAPGEIRLWGEVKLSGLFAQQSTIDSVHEALGLCALKQGLKPPAYRIKPLQDQAWERTWMDTYKPMQFGPHFWICPTHGDVVDPAAVTLRLDPGLAFGTGTHATTSQCLMWIGEQTTHSLQPFAGRTVIDYGCGSGVLAIACLMLGAERAWAVDIDEQALVATRENAQFNGVLDRISIGLPELADKIDCDVVFANILFQPLLTLADTLARCVRPGGELVISGILENQIEPLRIRYNSSFEFSETRVTENWAMLMARRRCE